MTPERVNSLAAQIRFDYALSRSAFEAIITALLQACSEQREIDAKIASQYATGAARNKGADMTTDEDCQHLIVTRWKFDDSTPANLWSCQECRRKFEPMHVTDRTQFPLLEGK